MSWLFASSQSKASLFCSLPGPSRFNGCDWSHCIAFVASPFTVLPGRPALAFAVMGNVNRETSPREHSRLRRSDKEWIQLFFFSLLLPTLFSTSLLSTHPSTSILKYSKLFLLCSVLCSCPLCLICVFFWTRFNWLIFFSFTLHCPLFYIHSIISVFLFSVFHWLFHGRSLDTAINWLVLVQSFLMALRYSVQTLCFFFVAEIVFSSRCFTTHSFVLLLRKFSFRAPNLCH